QLTLGLSGRLCLKWRTPGEQFVKRRTQPINIRAGSNRSRISGDLFGGHVTGSSHPRMANCDVCRTFKIPCQAEVRKFRGAVNRQENIARLDVAVTDPRLMSRVERPRQRSCY